MRTDNWYRWANALAVSALALWAPVAGGAESFEALKRRAMAGDVRAINDFATRLDDPDMAYKLFMEAASRGYAPAANNVGWCYREGQGVKKNVALAAQWFRKGAEGGDGWGQFNYGKALMDGEGVKRDVRSGLSWLERAVTNGIVPAIYEVGVYHETGVVIDGVSTRTNFVECTDSEGTVRRVAVPELTMTEDVVWRADEAEAMRWYRTAMSKGSAWGTWKVGRFAEYGIECKQDVEFALDCYRKAAPHVPQAAKDLERLEQQGAPPSRWAAEVVFDELKRQWMPERADELF